MSWVGCRSVAVALAILVATVVAAHAQSDESVDALNAKVEELHKIGRYADAVPIAQRAVALAELRSGTDHPNVAQVLGNLADLYYRQGRYAEAEPLHRRSFVIRERALGPDHPDVGTTLNGLAVAVHTQGRYEEAEPLFKRALAIREKALGPDHPDVGTTLNNLAVLYAVMGRYAEAELFYKRSLAIREAALGPGDARVGESLNNLAMLFDNQGRHVDAAALLQRAFAIHHKAMGEVQQGTLFGPAHRDFVVTSNNLGVIFYAQGQYAEAEQIYRGIASLLELMLGPDHADLGTALNNVAEVYRVQRRYTDAEPFFRRALSIWERALGQDHPLVALALDNLASSHQGQGRYADAEPLYQRGLGVREKVLGPDHPDVGQSLNNLAALAFGQRDWARAVDFWRRSTSLIVRRTQRGTSTSNARQGLAGKAKSEVERSSHQFWSLVKAVHRLAPHESDANAMDLRETFQTAQWAIASEAAQALAQMAARGAKGDPVLAMLVRERQDLVEEWQKRDGARNAALAQAPDTRDRAAEATNLTRLAAIDATIADIDKRLTADFPSYASLASPEPLSVEEVQTQLGAGEALVLLLDTPEFESIAEETFIWVVTKSAVRWVRSDLGKTALAREVKALRCGLDTAAWAGSSCAERLGQSYSRADQRAGKLLPFDHARAHKLYKALFGNVEDLIKGKHLLIVPSGPLTQLPFQVLVTAAPASDEQRSIRWLARDHALTVLPAVSSLKALRRLGHASAAGKPLIGFGNPLLDGAGADDLKYANLAREKQSCREIAPKHIAVLRKLRAGAVPLKTYSGLADLSHIRIQAPLPETADELCTVAQSMGADLGEMRLGARSTEREVKALSESGQLAQYRIVHFATHGAMAGELDGTSEPGLILTPPQEASAEDDGYLSASEIAGLKLDADWVILSACNTAAGEAASAEALSGLARAFIYAQARALLVSHWAVDSNATVKLITSATLEIARDPTVGRAEALRRSMLAMIDKGDPHEAHPSYWAPFVVVGEGTR